MESGERRRVGRLRLTSACSVVVGWVDYKNSTIKSIVNSGM